MDGSAELTLLGDERGSVVAYANDNGRVEQINTYDGFGKQKPWNEGTFRYTGQTWLPELSLYYYKARLYDPDMGRFLQVDSIGYEDQMNLYAYVGNDPMNLVDPTGEMGGPFTDAFGDLVSYLAGQRLEQRLISEFNEAEGVEARSEIARRVASVRRNLLRDDVGARQFVDDEIASRPRAARNPFEIQPTQNSARATFSDGGSVFETARGLKSGSISPNDITPIRVFSDSDGVIRTLDHRRLAAFQEAGLDSIPTVFATSTEVRIETRFKNFKGFGPVKIRGRRQR